MKFVYPQFTFAESNIVVGDYSISNIAVSDADANGFKTFASTNTAKIANPSSFAGASGLSPELDLPASLSGRYSEKSIEVKGEFMVSGSGTAPKAKFVISNVETGISAVEANNAATAGIYSATGVKYNKLQKGLNIVRKGGKTFKVLKK